MKEFRALYHVYNKSIDGNVIFNDQAEYERMSKALLYYCIKKQTCKLSDFLDETDEISQEIVLDSYRKAEGWVTIIGYCLMPTHLHLILAEMNEGGISKYMNLVLMSYTRYFNTKHERKGPLWQSRSKKVLVESNEQLLYLTRYLHLNPVTARIVDDPAKWANSSYNEYLGTKKGLAICDFKDALAIVPQHYKTFCLEYIERQRELAYIKKLLFD